VEKQNLQKINIISTLGETVEWQTRAGKKLLQKFPLRRV
jgi:hypothetical protein